MNARNAVAGFAFASLVFLSGCQDIAVTYTPLNSVSKPLANRSPESVQMFMTTAPTRRYVEVGMVKVEKRNAWHSDADLVNTLRTVGASHGCDAIVLSEKNRSMHGTIGSQVSVAEGVSDMTASCVVFTDAPAK